MSLKYQIHLVIHHDYFSIEQTEFLVIVQNCIHVFNPLSINWAIEDYPATRLAHILVCAFSEDLAKYTICKVVRDWIEASIELRHSDTLGIDNVSLLDYDMLISLHQQVALQTLYPL